MRSLAASLLFACLAVAIRLVGVFLSGVLLLAPRLPSTGWGPRLQRLAIAAAPVVVLALLMLTREELTAHRADLTWIEGSWPWRRAHLWLGLEKLPTWLAMNALVVTGVLGSALWPLALGTLSRENVRTALPGGLLVAAVLSGEILVRKWAPARSIRHSPGVYGNWEGRRASFRQGCRHPCCSDGPSRRRL